MNKHRIFHILNRNIEPIHKYNFNEIRESFLKEYVESTGRERVIYSRFFKELDIDDLESFIDVFDLSMENVINVYKDIPEKVFPGVSNKWDYLIN